MPKKPLRVLLWYWGRRGGGPRYTLELAKALAARGDVELYLSLSRQSDYAKQCEVLKARARLDVDTYRSFPGFVANSLRLPLIRRQFVRFLRKYSIGVVLCTMDHLWNAYMVGSIRNSGALYMLTVHDACRHPGENQPWREWLLARDIATSDGALVLTHSVGEALQQLHDYPADRIFESAHGHFGEYVRDAPRALPEDRPVRLLFFGRILPYKGLDLLLDAMEILWIKHPNLELEIWGDGDLSQYQGRIDRMGRVRLENRWIDEADILGIFKRTDLLVLPYREASQSGVVGIAQAYGMPCVATPIPGLCEQVQHEVNGVVVSTVEATSLADGLMSLIEQPELYAHLSQGCLETARHELSWDHIGETVLAAVRALHEKGRR
jgi:glycosyltransferase involved in cell wall biosynthesis